MITKPLTLEMVEGEIRISIGLETLALAAVSGPLWPRLRVLDPVEDFGRDVLNALRSEKEDGTTPVHELLDGAIQKVVDDGELSVVDEGDGGEEFDEDGEPAGVDPVEERRERIAKIDRHEGADEE